MTLQKVMLFRKQGSTGWESTITVAVFRRCEAPGMACLVLRMLYFNLLAAELFF